MKILGESRFHKKFFLVLTAFSILGILWAAEPALAAAKPEDEVSGKESIIFEGKESSDVKIRKNISVTGTSPAKAVINGDITMEDGSTLENVTINGRIITVTVAKDAAVTLTNVTVRGGSDAGIFVPKGRAQVTVRGSRIIKNRKGLFIESGNRVNLSGNQVADNDEEGLDLRSSISGSVTGNRFERNREGGMEVIIGGSSLTISGNTFSQNKSSGLALQTYSGSLGKTIVSRNAFSGNGNYGIDCNDPQGNGDQSTFKASISVRENTFSENKNGGIHKRCRLLNIEPSDEQAENETNKDEIPKVPPVPFEEEPSRIKEVFLEKLAGEVSSIEPQIKAPRSYRQNLRHYVLKSDTWYFATQRENIRRLQEQMEVTKSLPETERLTEINALFPGKVETMQKKLEELIQALDSQEHWSPWKKQ